MADDKGKKKRRGRGEGTIRQRENGRWEGKVSLGYDGNGKRRRVAVFGATKAEVQAKLRELLARADQGTLGEPSRETLGEYLDRWLEDAARPTIRATTYRSYEGMIRVHIREAVGGVRLAKLTPAHVQALYSGMEKDGASPRLRQLAHAILHRALKQAMKWGLVPRNVCEAVDPPRVPKKTMAVYTIDQAKAILTAVSGHRWEALIVLAVTTGLRQGELFGLHWTDLDLEAGTLAVQRQVTEVGGELSLTEPKTASGRRRIELPALAVDALRRHRERLVEEGKYEADGPVFRARGGEFIRKSNFTREFFRPLLQKAGLPRIRFHDLRHTSATLLLAAGEHPRVVQERLGHKDITLTLGTYSHVLPSLQKDAARKMDGLLGGPTEKPALTDQTAPPPGQGPRPHGSGPAPAGDSPIGHL